MQTTSAHIVALLLALSLALPLGAQVEERIHRVEELETLPRALNPEDFHAALRRGYPPELLTEGVEGTVSVGFVVAADGTVREPAVVHSSHPGFDSASLAAVGVLRFAPATADGRAVPVRLEFPIIWRGGEVPEAEEPASDPPPVDDEHVYPVAEVDVLPRLRNGMEFGRSLEQGYPEPLRQARRGGIVEVTFRIDQHGRVHEPRVIRSAHPAFNQPTLAAVRRMRFDPAVKDGRPVSVWVHQPIAWAVSM